MFSRIHKTALVFLTASVLATATFLAGCNTTSVMPVQKAPEASSTESAATTPASQQSKFVLTRIVSGIKRGTVIAHFPSGDFGVDGYLCNHSYRSGNATLEWDTGKSMLGDWSTELGTVFHDSLTARGFNVAGDPKDLFNTEDSVVGADYRVGARITAISGNFCEIHHWWDGHPMGEYSGEMSMTVDWVVLSAYRSKKSTRPLRRAISSRSNRKRRASR